MSDMELERLRRKKMAFLQKNITVKAESKTEESIDSKEVLNSFFSGRAWEVFNAAKTQYPQQATQVEKLLVRLIRTGKINDRITGERLYLLFRRLGLRIKLETHIRVLKDGKIKSLEEKIKEENSK